jgi:uncharacterized protein (DUF1330 family)
MSALFIAISRITDQEKLDQYIAGAPASLAGRQLEVLSYTQDGEDIEGHAPGTRVVILRFPDKAAAMDWYNSPEYQAVVGLRLQGTEGFSVLCTGL